MPKIYKYIIFGHNDSDGLLSQYLVKHKLIKIEDSKVLDDDIYCLSIDYNYIVDNIIDSIDHNSVVFILDVAIKKYNIDKLMSKTKNIIIIDHHGSQPYMIDCRLCVCGSRTNKKSACLMTLDFIEDALEIYCEPLIKHIIELISISDTGQISHPLYNNARYVNMSISASTSLELNILEDIINTYLLNNTTIEQIIEDGKNVENVIRSIYDKLISESKYETTICGYDIIYATSALKTSEVFYRFPDKDYYILYYGKFIDGEFKACHSVYSNKQMNCNKIASMFDGGGHPHASGFVLDHPVTPNELGEKIKLLNEKV